MLIPAIVLLWLIWSLGLHELKSLPHLSEGLAQYLIPIRSSTPGEFLQLWGSRAASLIVFLIYQLSCWSLGWHLARATRLLRNRRLALLLSLPLGWGLMGLIIFGLALCGLAARPILTVTALAPALLLWRSRIAQTAWGKLRTIRLMPTTWPQAVCLIALGFITVAALAPETGVDPLVYHYERGHRTLLLHKHVPRVYNHYDRYPSLWEMVLVPLTAIGGELPTRWFNPLLLGFATAVLYRLARVGLPSPAAWTAAALLASSLLFGGQAIFAKNDLLVCAMGLSAFLASQGAGLRRRTNGLVTGWLCGCAFLVKYTAGPVLPAIGAAMFVSRMLSLKVLRNLLAGFLAAALPLLAHNWLSFGDPVSPFGPVLSGSPSLFTLSHVHPSPITRWSTLEQFISRTGGEETFTRWAIFLPALLLIKSWTPLTRSAGAGFGILMLFWALGPPHPRYGIVAMPLGILLISMALLTPRRHGEAWSIDWIRRGLYAALALQALHLIVYYPLALASRAGLGLESPGHYRTRMLAALAEAAEFVNARIPSGSVILLHGEWRGALLAHRTDVAGYMKVAFPPFPLLKASRSSAEVFKRVRQKGWTHLLYNRLGAFYMRRQLTVDPWSERELKLWAAFWRKHAEPVWESTRPEILTGHFYLFRFVQNSRRRSTHVLPGIEGWIALMEEDQRAGRDTALSRRRTALQQAAGGYGIVDRVEAGMFKEQLPPEEVRRLLKRAARRGLHSPL